MNKYIYYIWLNSFEISADKKARLVEYFGSAKDVYEAEEDELLACELLNEKQIEILLDKSLKKAQKEFDRAEKNGIALVCIEDEIYPESLLNIYDPPILLYAKGDASLLKRKLCFCVVGTRSCTPYGLTAAMNISCQLAECGMVIVSGLANGIDSAAHQGALKCGGKTIGVAACGINVAYPAGNGALRKKILETGLIISEFPIDRGVRAHHFQIRNRILSGLSLGVAVIEANYRSGALITAKHAREQNRDVFSLPGNITSRTSAGCNKLISDGATAILGAQTILSEYLPKYAELFEIDDYMEEYKAEEKRKEDAFSTEELKKSIDGDGDDEKTVIALLKDGSKNFEELVAKTGFQTSHLNVLLTTMQINGKITESAGRNFSLK